MRYTCANCHLTWHTHELQAAALAYLIIGEKKHDVQEASKLQLLLTRLVITLSFAAPASCRLASLQATSLVSVRSPIVALKTPHDDES